MKAAPCFGCKKRTKLCHGSCEKYREWRKEHAKEVEGNKAIARKCYTHSSEAYDRTVTRNLKRRLAKQNGGF